MVSECGLLVSGDGLLVPGGGLLVSGGGLLVSGGGLLISGDGLLIPGGGLLVSGGGLLVCVYLLFAMYSCIQFRTCLSTEAELRLQSANRANGEKATGTDGLGACCQIYKRPKRHSRARLLNSQTVRNHHSEKSSQNQ